MNKRQGKKFDENLYKAIKELNEEIMGDFEIDGELSEESLTHTFYKVKGNPVFIKRTMKNYKGLLKFRKRTQ